jgi:hypothetical protein
VTPDLLLFSTRPTLIAPAVAGGVAGIVVDCERVGKAARQRGADTHIAADTLDDLARVRGCTNARVICRIDGPGPWTGPQVESAIDAGADEILLPMVRRPEEVEVALAAADARAVGILIETREALDCTEALAALPLSRAYVGLNDLAIERGTPSLFTALVDGTVETIRAAVEGVPFGFAGLTIPGGGSPVPTCLLLGELARLGADFTFLRRSFWRDVEGRDVAAAVVSMRAAASASEARSPSEVASDRAALLDALDATGAPV